MGPAVSPSTRDWRRWLYAAAVWTFCTAIGVSVTVWYVTSTKEVQAIWLVAGLAAWVFVLLHAAATIQRRPSDAMMTTVISAGAFVMAGLWWMDQVLSLRGSYGMRFSAQPIWALGPGEFGRWYAGWALMTVLPAAASLGLLFKWMDLRTRVVIFAAVVALTPLAALAIAQFPPLDRVPRPFMIGVVLTHTAALLAWACVAKPYGWEWMYQCRGCGYDLRGLTVDRCPECGRPARALPLEDGQA